MKERPILFSAPMVRALLAGTKTQTRRVCKPAPVADARFVGGHYFPGKHKGAADISVDAPYVGMACPYGQFGDRLWVRETHRLVDCSCTETCRVPGNVWYEADCSGYGGASLNRLRPSIHMPRWANRITLEITGVRVERLQSISEADSVAEGCKAKPFPGPWWQGYRRDDDGYLFATQSHGEQPPEWMVEPRPMRPLPHLDRSAVDEYQLLWNSINGPGSWDANPFVWVIEFRRIAP